MNQKKAQPQKLLRRMGFSAILFLSLAAAAGTQARAATILMLSIEPVSISPGGAGAFDVLVTNPSTSPVNVGGFNFEVDTTDTDVTFQGTTVNTTTATYIFAGNSSFGPTLNFDSPGQAMDGADVVATPNSFTTLNPGDTFGLGNVNFTVSPTAANPSVATVTFNLSNTSITDAGGGALSFTTTDGAITITSTVTTTPEPSGWVLGAIAFPALGFIVRRRKLQAAAATLTNR